MFASVFISCPVFYLNRLLEIWFAMLQNKSLTCLYHKLYAYEIGRTPEDAVLKYGIND